jgi:hypothetical protein
VLNILDEFFKFKDMNINVKTINGKMTSFTRFAINDRKKGYKLLRPINLPLEKFESFDKNGKKNRL